MRTLATKQPTNDSAQQKKKGGRGRSACSSASRSRSVSPLSTAMPLLQRKCACGGGCPRCQGDLAIQTKLELGEPGDKYEQEADHIADQVMRMPEPGLRRQVNEEEEEELLQTKPMGQERASGDVGEHPEVPPIVHDVLRSPGRSLDPQTRSFMESRFGHDFSQVRIHTDGKAVHSAQAVNALAYTVKRDIVFAAGQYAPETSAGKHLLVHELAHVVQQRGTHINTIQRKKHLCENDPKTAPAMKDCRIATTPPPGPSLDVFFTIEDDTLSATDIDELHNLVQNWHDAGGSDTVRVDGFASCDGHPKLNWSLSCDRALAVANELLHPSPSPLHPTLKGIDPSFVDIFANGETDRFSTTDFDKNRKAIATLFAPPPTPVPSPTPVPRSPSIDHWVLTNSGDTSPENCCRDCPVKLGKDCHPSTGFHFGMQHKALIRNHRPGVNYEFERKLHAKIWVNSLGGFLSSPGFKLFQKNGPNFDDNPPPKHECSTPHPEPPLHAIFVRDRPGIAAIAASPRTPRLAKSSDIDAVMIVNFKDSVRITEGGTAKEDPNVGKWHVVIWVSRLGGTRWFFITGKSVLAVGHRSNLDP